MHSSGTSLVLIGRRIEIESGRSMTGCDCCGESFKTCAGNAATGQRPIRLGAEVQKDAQIYATLPFTEIHE